MKTLLHTRLSHRTICTLLFLWFVLLFLVYLGCLYWMVVELKENPASRLLVPAAGGYILHKKTGARVYRFIKTKVFVRR